MAIAIDVAGTVIPTDASALKGLKKELDFVFHLDATMTALLDSRLDGVPASAASSKVSYGGPAQSWNPSDGPVTFGLQENVGGVLRVVTGGTLLTYSDGLTLPQTKSIPVPAGTTYMVLTLDFGVSANVAGTYSNGPYGVKASLDTADLYQVTYCRAMAPATTVRSAIAQVFQSYVLPLHKDTLTEMNDGDYLLHEFEGNVHLAFGAYVGLDKVLYAGQSSVDVLKALGSPLATFRGGVSPDVKAGVGFDFSFAYASRFESLLSKESTQATLQMFRSAKRSTTTTLKAGLVLDGGVTGKITASTGTVKDSMVNAVGGAGSAAGTALGLVLKEADGEIGKYVAEANTEVASWLNKANGIKTNLEMEIETMQGRAVLAGYRFDLGSPQMDAAWGAAMGGDLLAAFKTGAVTLDAGSGLEQEYRRRTTFRCNVFHLWSASTWTEYAEKSSLVYAGNNVFHLMAQVGRMTETESMGAMHSMDLYFTANANTEDAVTVTSPEVDLQVHLTAQKDAKAMGAMATMLSAMEAGPVCDALARDLHAFATRSPQGTAQVQVTVPPAAYRRINCDVYANGKPATTSTYNDAVNWAAFARAADDLNAWPLRDLSTVSLQWLAFLKSFAAWEELNETSTGSNTPNRLETGNTAQWPSDFPSVEGGDRALIRYSMGAGQSFMNFCEALRGLASMTDTGTAGTTWNALLAMITATVKNDVNVDFLRPTGLAILRLCGAPAAVVSGPASGVIPADHFSVCLKLQA